MMRGTPVNPPNQAHTGSAKEAATLSRGRLQRITDWEAIAVHACYSSSALAQFCGVSLRHLQRHIRSAHNQNLGQWLNGLRMKHAYRKLTSGATVKETAYSLGFKQVSHFSRLFKQHYGLTPSSVPITVTGSPSAPGRAQEETNPIPGEK